MKSCRTRIRLALGDPIKEVVTSSAPGIDRTIRDRVTDAVRTADESVYDIAYGVICKQVKK